MDHNRLVQKQLMNADLDDLKRRARASQLGRVGNSMAMSLQALVDDPGDRLAVLVNLLGSYATGVNMPMDELERLLRANIDDQVKARRQAALQHTGLPKGH